MKLRTPVELIGLTLALGIIAALGCEARPAKPMTTIPKNQPEPKDDWPEIDREAAEAAGRRPTVIKQPVADARPSQPVESESKPVEPVPVEPVTDLAGNVTWLDADGSQLPMEYWEAQYFNAQRIGITHYRIEEAGKRELKIRMETNMQITRGERPLKQSVVIETRESMDGQMQRFSETLSSGVMVSQTNGNVNGNELKLKSESPERSSKQIEWPNGSWGPMGIHQMLLRKPMLPGETRKATLFLPQMHQLAQVTLVAGKVEDTTSPEGLLADVLPIDVSMQLSESGIKVRMWADNWGRIQKTIWPEGLNLSSFRISRQAAIKLQSEDEIESYLNTALPLAAAYDEIEAAKQVQYAITSDQPDPHDLFSAAANQTVKPKPVYEALVTVFAMDWQSPAPPGVEQTAPSLNELSNSTLLPSDADAIGRLAQQWSGQATEPVEIIKALLSETHRRLRKLPFRPVIQPVPVVAQNLEGDCVEHAMLLATLLRNRQISARVASGLRLQPGDGQANFEYHMWTEAWLNDRWVPIDATTGQLTSCAYLKFIDTSLTDIDPYQCVLSVLRKLKHLKVGTGEVVGSK